MTKHPPSNGFIPGDFYKREDDVIMVEIKPGVYVNQVTALTRHGISPRKAKRGGHHGPQGT